METSKLIPKEIVRDFSLEKFIQDELFAIKTRLKYINEESDKIKFISGVIQVGSNTLSYNEGIAKYRNKVDPPIITNLAPYILRYIFG